MCVRITIYKCAVCTWYQPTLLFFNKLRVQMSLVLAMRWKLLLDKVPIYFSSYLVWLGLIWMKSLHIRVTFFICTETLKTMMILLQTLNIINYLFDKEEFFSATWIFLPSHLRNLFPLPTHEASFPPPHPHFSIWHSLMGPQYSPPPLCLTSWC